MTTAADRALLQRLAAGPVSGDALAREAGQTRAAVWKRIQGLRQAGLAIDARPGIGYALAAPVDLLDSGRIAAELPADLRAGAHPLAGPRRAGRRRAGAAGRAPERRTRAPRAGLGLAAGGQPVPVGGARVRGRTGAAGRTEPGGGSGGGRGPACAGRGGGWAEVAERCRG